MFSGLSLKLKQELAEADISKEVIRSLRIDGMLSSDKGTFDKVKIILNKNNIDIVTCKLGENLYGLSIKGKVKGC